MRKQTKENGSIEKLRARKGYTRKGRVPGLLTIAFDIQTDTTIVTY